MTTSFRIEPIKRASVAHFFAMSDAELRRHGARRVQVNAKPGFPCRLSLVDAEVGEEVILLHHPHHEADSPYRAGGPIYVRDTASATVLPNELPEVLLHRQLSFRAYDAKGFMRDAATSWGKDAKATIRTLLENPAVAYIHIHNAAPGCYSCKVVRLGAS